MSYASLLLLFDLLAAAGGTPGPPTSGGGAAAAGQTLTIELSPYLAQFLAEFLHTLLFHAVGLSICYVFSFQFWFSRR